MTDNVHDLFEIEEVCTILNKGFNYLIYPITICEEFNWKIIAEEIKDGYEDLKKAKEQGKERFYNEETEHIIVIQFEKDMKI